jgi:hypothetical protein
MLLNGSKSRLGFVVMGIAMAAGCGGDGGGGGDDAQPEGGSAGGDATTGGTGGKGGGAGKGGSSAGTSSGRGGADSETAGAAGDAGGAGFGAVGSGGEAGDASVAGAAGADTGPSSCSSGTCCLSGGAVCVEIPDGVHVSVTTATEAPDLGTGVTVVSEPIAVDFVQDPTDPITVVATIDEGIDPGVVVVVHVDADGNQTDVDAAIEDGSVTIVVDGDGTYVVGVVDTTPPEGCAPNELEGPIQVSSNLQADLVDGVTRIDGDLSLDGAVSTLESLRCLTHVTGNVTVGNASALVTLPLPYLAVIGGRVKVGDAPLLTTIALTRLRKIGVTELESIALATLPALFSVDFRRLPHAPGSLVMSAVAESAAEPLTMAFSKLESVGGGVNLSIASDATAAFGALRHVQGSVALSTTGANLSGFSSLESIGGALSLHVPSVEIVRFDALTNVGSVQGQDAWPLSLEVAGGVGLHEVGFPLLAHVPGSVVLHGGASVTELMLELALEHVGGRLSIDVGAETTQLTSLAGLTHVGGDLELTGRFPAVPLPHLESVDGALAVESSEATSVSAPALTTVGSSVIVVNCPALTTVELGALTTINAEDPALQYALDFRNLPALASCELSALSESGGSVQFASVGDGALDLDLASLTRVRGDLIGYTLGATRFDTSALTTVDGSILLWDIDSPLEFGEVATIGGQFNVQASAATHVDLGALTSVGGSSALGAGSFIAQSMTLLEHVDLGSLAGMPSHFRLLSNGDDAANPLALELSALTAIGGDLEIDRTHNLANADAFIALTSIGQNLSITGNGDLVNLYGLDGLTEVGENLTISRNATLPTCAAEALATRLGGVSFDGTVTIGENLSDTCN